MQPPPLRQRESQRNTQTSPPNAGLGVDPAQLKHLLLLCCFSLCLYLCVCFVKSSCCSVTKLCPTLCDPMDCSTPGLPVLHHLPELLKLMSIESVMPSNQLILCHPLLLLPSIFPSIGSFLFFFFERVYKLFFCFHPKLK